MDYYKPPPPAFVSGRYPKIYWTGHGSNINGLHTKKEFLEQAKRIILYDGYLYMRRKGDPYGFIPEGQVKHNDVEGYMRIVGAKWIYPKKKHALN